MVDLQVMRRTVQELRNLGLSERWACRVVGLRRSTQRYQRRHFDDPLLVQRLLDLATERPRFGYRRLHILLQREGFQAGQQRIYRIYREADLAVRRKPRKRLAAVQREPLPVVAKPDQQWNMDFTKDSLAGGRCFRTLNVVDACTRECLAIEVDTSLPGKRVVRVLERLADERGLPEVIVVDNGPEFVCKSVDAWAHARGVSLRFIRPGKPIENAYIESFNGKFRDECLNLHLFRNLDRARAIIEAWRQDYNEVRPHSSLENLTPAEFVRRWEAAQQEARPLAAASCYRWELQN